MLNSLEKVHKNVTMLNTDESLHKMANMVTFALFYHIFFNFQKDSMLLLTNQRETSAEIFLTPGPPVLLKVLLLLGKYPML
jgi:hypothetical protein